MNKSQAVFLLAVGLGLATGCSSTRGTASWSKPFGLFASRSTESQSELAADEKREVSDEFKAAQKILKKDPEGTILAYAKLKEDNEEYTEARERYREMLIAYPDNIDAQLGLARIELATGRTQQAEEILMALADMHPQNLAVQRQLGQMYVLREDWSSAKKILETACADHPKDQTVAFELGLAYAKTNELNKAMDRLSFAVGESAAMYNIGYVLNEQGRPAEATSWFQSALKNHPDARTSHQAQQMLARINEANARSEYGSQLAGYNRNHSPQTHSTALQRRENGSSGSAVHTATWSSPKSSSSNMTSPQPETAITPAHSVAPSNQTVPAWSGPASSTVTDSVPDAQNPADVVPPSWRSR